MSMTVDIRKYSLDNILSHLIESSVIKKKWFGKSTDNYWNYLDANTTKIETELNSHIIADLLAYLYQEKKLKLGFENESNTISVNRGTGVLLIHPTEIVMITSIISEPKFMESFESYAKELNGEFFDYSKSEISQTINEFTNAISIDNQNMSIIINIG
ncbi:MAG: hypothetical protein IPH66_07240 [Crocinitomicaceae bacterium]|nr:hypothetical protein [Crocinitomicaceae bacterium]